MFRGGCDDGSYTVRLRANLDLFILQAKFSAINEEDHQLLYVGQRLRIGGMIIPSSAKRDPQILQVTFKMHDAADAIAVSYVSILLDLFSEEWGNGAGYPDAGE